MKRKGFKRSIITKNLDSHQLAVLSIEKHLYWRPLRAWTVYRQKLDTGGAKIEHCVDDDLLGPLSTVL